MKRSSTHHLKELPFQTIKKDAEQNMAHSEIDKKRPRPAALMKLIAADLLEPLGAGVHPPLADYEPIDIVKVWKYGPLGYEGNCWAHKVLNFYIAKLDDQDPWLGIVPNFGVEQVNRMIIASHKLDGYRYRGGNSRRSSGYAGAFFEFRLPTTCMTTVIEENYDRTGLTLRALAHQLKEGETCSWNLFNLLYPAS